MKSISIRRSFEVRAAANAMLGDFAEAQNGSEAGAAEGDGSSDGILTDSAGAPRELRRVKAVDRKLLRLLIGYEVRSCAKRASAASARE